MSRRTPSPGDGSPPPTDPAAYDYALPAGRIALRPASPRDQARLLVLRRNRPGEAPEDRRVHDLPELLAPGDLLVVNETKVVPARLVGTLERREKEVELLLVREISPGRWAAWVRPAKAFRPGDRILFAGQATSARFLTRRDETAEIAFDGDAADLLAARGHVPLPPYIARPDDLSDRSDYQTVFARVPGAVAAPTAGLHFTPELLERLGARGIAIAKVLLHVGPGTFRPVRMPDIRAHHVEAEFYRISDEAARAMNEVRGAGGRIVAVGTTCVRALESWARATDPARLGHEGWTDLTIVPPFSFKAVDVLMTNFHLPRSSLLLLVSAFAGRERVLTAYDEAVRRSYRFYSYGDAMLVL